MALLTMEVLEWYWRARPSIAVHVVPANLAFESRLSWSHVSACAQPVVPVSYPRTVVSSQNIQRRLLMRLIATMNLCWFMVPCAGRLEGRADSADTRFSRRQLSWCERAQTSRLASLRRVAFPTTSGDP